MLRTTKVFLSIHKIVSCDKNRLYSQIANKSNLSILRKRTGLAFSICKEALLKNDNQIEKAEKWLENESIRQGWAKANSLCSRSMSEGLLGLVKSEKTAVVLEVNCETDFVSRNSGFQNLVANATEAVMNHFKNMNSCRKIALNSDQLNELVSTNDVNLKDMLSITIGTVGENMMLRRAVGLRVNDDKPSFLAFYCHMSGEGIKQSIRDVRFGKYAALIQYSPLAAAQISSESWKENAAHVGRQICQHIVGMNPRSGIEPPDSTENLNPDEENYLFRQPFLLNENILVGDYLTENGITVEDFVRIECGQVELESNVTENSESVKCVTR